MILKSSIKKILLITLTAVVLMLIIVFSDISINGVNNGLLISTNVIIPSLFPFTVFVLMFIKSNITVKNKFIEYIIKKIFGLDFELFTVFVLSTIGGYPIGAKLITEMFKKGKLDRQSANVMLLYCVNAGPAFIISAVGASVFYSVKIGVILLLSHLFTSFLIAILMSKKFKNRSAKRIFKGKITTFSEILTESVTDASAAVLQICAFVVLFSVITDYFEYFFKDAPIINKLSYFLEVTSAVTKTHNIIFVSFLLGFSGVSIWFQVFSIGKEIGINYFKFILGRIAHGSISSILTYLILKIFKINVSVFSNEVLFKKRTIYSSLSVSVSLVIMITVLLIYLYSKNSSRKMIDDVI